MGHLYILLVVNCESFVRRHGFLINGAMSVWGAPALTQKETGENATEDNNEMYSLSSHVHNVKDNCTRELHIFGKGIKENFTLPCSVGEIFSINSDKLLIYEDLKNSFFLFSDRPSTLEVIKNGKCTLKSYKKIGTMTSSKSTEMTHLECEKVKQKIAYEKEESWILWKKNFEDSVKIIFPPSFPLY